MPKGATPPVPGAPGSPRRLGGLRRGGELNLRGPLSPWVFVSVRAGSGPGSRRRPPARTAASSIAWPILRPPSPDPGPAAVLRGQARRGGRRPRRPLAANPIRPPDSRFSRRCQSSMLTRASRQPPGTICVRSWRCCSCSGAEPAFGPRRTPSLRGPVHAAVRAPSPSIRHRRLDVLNGLPGNEPPARTEARTSPWPLPSSPTPAATARRTPAPRSGLAVPGALVPVDVIARRAGGRAGGPTSGWRRAAS